MESFRFSLGTKHPYSPASANLPGYEPAILPFGVTLAVFFGLTALVGTWTWTATGTEKKRFIVFRRRGIFWVLTMMTRRGVFVEA